VAEGLAARATLPSSATYDAWSSSGADEDHVKWSLPQGPVSGRQGFTSQAAVSASRPYLPAFPTDTLRFTPAGTAVNTDVATTNAATQTWDPASNRFVQGGQGVLLVQSSKPLDFVVEQEVVDRFGMAPLAAAVEQFNAVPGVRLRATIAATSRDNVRAPVQDGTMRIFFDDATCRGGDLAWAHLLGLAYDVAYGGRQVAIGELDLGLCRGLGGVDLFDTIGHELLHGAGMGHLCNTGDACFETGMAPINTCRLMFYSARSCQDFGAADARGLGFLHPSVPRYAGPSRVDTAARASFALRGLHSTQDVVLVDGRLSPDLAIQAAGLASTLDAPLLLTSGGTGCISGSTGQEINRSASDGALIWLVGPMPSTCAVDLRSWELNTRSLSDGAAIADAILGSAGIAGLPVIGPLINGVLPPFDPEDQTILIARGARNGDSPDALAAAAVSGSLNAPVLYSQGTALGASEKQWLDGRSGLEPGHAIVVGGPRAVPETVVAELQSYGIDVIRLSGASRIDTALALAKYDPAFGTERKKVLIAAADRWADTVTASAAGGANGWPVVLVYRDVVPDTVVQYLRTTSAAAVIVGGSGVVSNGTQWTLSQLVGRLP
jgi:putative cell wall-binding protein